jgi:hypothetical protein
VLGSIPAEVAPFMDSKKYIGMDVHKEKISMAFLLSLSLLGSRERFGKTQTLQQYPKIPKFKMTAASHGI